VNMPISAKVCAGSTHAIRQMGKIGGRDSRDLTALARARLGAPVPRWARVVQQESTATGLDSDGLVRTSWDGDLRLYTRVDGLPLDGMQEVWDSNPHSSTAGQRYNTKS
jgi:hypothetical protein